MADFNIASVLNRDHEEAGGRPVSPTDLSQYIRLDQCQRYLRLQLHSRQWGERFLEDFDVAQQQIPPILTRSGATFEQLVEEQASKRFPSTRLDAAQRHDAHTLNNNADIVELARKLPPGESHVIFQPRVEAHIANWQVRGDIDLLQFHRDPGGTLRCLIADMKSSTATKIEHRLQVAVYHEMLASILDQAGVSVSGIELAIIYRGPVPGTIAAESADPETESKQRKDALDTLGTDAGMLERIEDAQAYIDSVHDLLIGPESVARRVLSTDFDALPYHLTYKCDGCRFNEFCMKRSAETDDLSLLPHLTDQDKTNLRANRVTSVQQVAELKELVKGESGVELVPAPGKEELGRQLAVTWPIGQRLDELIHRAQSYMSWKHGRYPDMRYIPHKGYGTLPYNDANLHPNLIRIYIDAQHDYLNDRIYMLGSRVVASNNGEESLGKQRNIVRMTAEPPTTNEIEKTLFLDWIEETLRAVVELAAPDADGNMTAPIHLIFVNRFAQQQLLNGLGRYLDEILGATALYDFMTQMAAFDSPIASFLEQEIRIQKNYPMVCQSLQAVAAFLRFDWNEGTPYREIFRTRMFDFWRQHDAPNPGERGWYTGRARFNSQIPLEYAYIAWGQIIPEEETADALKDYQQSTPELLQGFHARRLEAMEHVAKDFVGNKQTQLSSFALPDLASFEQRAPSLAHALDEFITIERFVELSAWKSERLAPPEQRVLNGVSLIVRYLEEDQDEGIAGQNRENAERHVLRAQFYEEYRAANPDKKRVTLTKEQREVSKWDHEGIHYKLRLETDGLACGLDDVLNLTTIKEGQRLALRERWSVDSRLPEDERKPFNTTAKQLLGGQRVILHKIIVERDDEGHAIRAFADVEMTFGMGPDKRGFLFGGRSEPLVPDALYTLEGAPDDINGLWAAKVVAGLIDGGENTLYSHLTRQPTSRPIEPDAARAEGQRRFLDGLEALREVGEMFSFEPGKHDFIGDHGDDPVLLVQGPPGTGKSFSTAYALLARIQGAMAAGTPCRVLLSCKTHAATDVLQRNLLSAQDRLRELFRTHPDIMEPYFDRRLLDVPLYRQRPRGDVPEGIIPLDHDMKPKDVIADISAHQWSVTASTPGGIYSMMKNWLFTRKFIDCVVLDEASQMSIPEAIMATLPLQPDGRLIVVGDHRQMPPIVSHDWANETRRTFREFQSYESLFYALFALNPPKINFEESFRLHADLAEFLRKEIYRHDGINYHSNLDDVLPSHSLEDDFVGAVLAPDHPLTVIVHDEVASQQRNEFEQELIAPVLRALADEATYAYTPLDGLGVVVPHRAQRADLREKVPELSLTDPETETITISAVDTVERFQGDERTVIIVSATESDPAYLLAAGEFLFDPRRLTVALSRAKRKMVLVASRSIFELFSADEDMFRNVQLWKNLLRDTCTQHLWSGTRHGHHVEVWGNRGH